MTPHDPEALSRLRGFLEVTRVVRSEEELGGLLASIAQSISESLGFATVPCTCTARRGTTSR